ncbi:TATA box-binding protein associated factor RNA polymerase I subunit C [Tasmannia lanceolata]|uniref:TATA box-binding protein associated factor RNA polymerase I subunit C n=1 Tax=Tasmannia lanceolata TaxID=3420 RepID=UPI004064127B
MDFSENWKSLWSISSVFPAPLLLRGPAAKPLGPLQFSPSPRNPNPTLLLSSPSLSPQFPPPLPPSYLRNAFHAFFRACERSLTPSSLLTPIFLDAISDDDHLLFPNHNSLHVIRRPNLHLILFFPTGDNSDRIGYMVLSSKQRILMDNDGNGIFMVPRGLNHRILNLSATFVDPMDYFPSGNSSVEGFLLACSLYSIHWFRIESRDNTDIPALVHLATADFRCCVSHACWSPHLREECVVLLESGELRLFDLKNTCLGVSRLPVRLCGTRVRFSMSDLGGVMVDKGEWLSCEFSWHPRILIVACSTVVFLVDLRCKESKLNVLAKIEMCDSFRVHSIEMDRFIAFCKSGFNDFLFSVATEYHLLLFDTRQPLTPVLQWDHGLDSPRYINMFRLSELRPSSKDGAFNWASESGFAILLGSFWNCEFSVFCYGPSLPDANASVACKISKLCNSLYAWELPSGLSLSGCQCCCGDCLVGEEFSKAVHPVGIDWQEKKEMVLGFYIIAEDLSTLTSESDLEDSSKTNCLGGFTLIRLMSSGKLECQRYQASWHLVSTKSHSKEDQLHSEDSLLYSRGQEDKIPTRCRFLNFDYLFGDLSGNLSSVLALKMQNPHVNCAETNAGPIKRIYWTLDSRELICDKLTAAGVDQIGSFPAIADVLSDISIPNSLQEISSKRIWAGLSLKNLHLAFFKYSDLLGGQNMSWIEFLDVPAILIAQLPPFFLRKPSRRSEKWSYKASQSDALVGPVLPLSSLLLLKHVKKKKNMSGLEVGMDDISAEAEVIHQCDKFIKVAKDLHSLDYTHSVSLSDDDEKWVLSQELRKQKPFFLFELGTHSDATTMCHENNSGTTSPVKEGPNQRDEMVPPCLMSESISKDRKFTTFISGMQTKAPDSNPAQELVRIEMFDDLSPVQLNFDIPPINFATEELKFYKCIKRQFSNWQGSFKPHEDFCTSFKIPKQSQ